MAAQQLAPSSDPLIGTEQCACSPSTLLPRSSSAALADGGMQCDSPTETAGEGAMIAASASGAAYTRP